MKRKQRKGNILIFICFVFLGFLCGTMGARSYKATFIAEQMNSNRVTHIAITLLFVLLASYIQIVVHEGGHLVFGLLSGYRFSSFRIGSFMFCVRDGKVVCKRYRLSGTGGQCLMSPPAYNEGNFPYMLYNFGGALMNLIFAGLFYCLSLSVQGYLSLCFGIFALFGLVYALVNGIPMRLAMVDNDGSNAMEMKKSPQARRAFWIQLVINERLIQTRLKDMPKEWFELPEQPDYDSGLVGALSVFAENRAMDEHNFEQATEMILLSQQFEHLPGLYRFFMGFDERCIRLFRNETVEPFDRQEMRMMKQMKNLPNILRTKYVDALLNEHNPEKAKQIRDEFETVITDYPYPADAEGERSLMNYADSLFGD